MHQYSRCALLDPSPQKLERWRRIAAEAAEQSERSFVPTILEPVAFNTGLSLVIGHLSFVNSQQYICEARGEFPHLKHCLQHKGQMTSDKGQETIVIATGPEGGWTTQEIENAIASGFQPVFPSAASESSYSPSSSINLNYRKL